MTHLTHRCSRSQPVLSTALRALLPALALLAGGALPLAGQEPAQPSRVTLSGQVIDRSTGRPLEGAIVEVAGTHQQATTDAEGRFSFRRVRAGEHTLYAGLLGYADLEQPVRVGGGDVTVSLALAPDAVLLEGLTVKMNVLEQRRRRVAFSSRAFGREEIRSTAAPNVEAFLRGRGGMMVSRCRRAGSFSDTCVWSRGSFVPVAVYLDEMPIGSMDHLMGLQPEEVERIEVYQQGRHVRVYTTWFMEQVARGKRWVNPVFVR